MERFPGFDEAVEGYGSTLCSHVHGSDFISSLSKTLPSSGLTRLMAVAGSTGNHTFDLYVLSQKSSTAGVAGLFCYLRPFLKTMPKAAKHPCAIRTCPELTDKRFCPKHEKEHWDKVNANNKRLSPANRGYDSAWNRVRKAYLAAHPLCEECNKAGRTKAAQLVHHKEPVDKRPDLRLSYSNLESLCKECHEKKHGYDKR
jgi:5-methylcytosine-specific restriction protein A